MLAGAVLIGWIRRPERLGFRFMPDRVQDIVVGVSHEELEASSSMSWSRKIPQESAWSHIRLNIS